MPHDALFADRFRRLGAAVAACIGRLPCRASLAALATLTGLLAPTAATALPDLEPGLRASEASWPRWQGRIGLNPNARGPGLLADAPGTPSLSLFGDYYFAQQGVTAPGRYAGGFRATGGLIVGPRTAHGWAPPDKLSSLAAGLSLQRTGLGFWNSMPSPDGTEAAATSRTYIGVGYSGLKSLKATGGGWGFSADIGVMALQPRSAVRLGQQHVGDIVGDLHLSPLLQLGVSYSF